MGTLRKQSLNSVEQLKKAIGDFKRLNRTVLTNYIPDQGMHTRMVERGGASVYTFEGGMVMTFDKCIMLEAIFISVLNKDVKEWLDEISAESGKPVVAEHVFREGKDITLPSPDHVLRRMSRIGAFETAEAPSGRVEKAKTKDIPAIRALFNDYFNPLTERIPDDGELERLIDNDGISIIRCKGGISGMVIYEKNASNIHLRYWWVSPEQRGRGIGADLLRDYFCSGIGCRRQFLWVFSNNTDAIEKYRHYGFEFDGVADNIYIANTKI